MNYPIYLDLRGRRCVVVGGGSVAERKVNVLIERDAEVVVISPELSPRLAGLAREGKIAHVPRAYAPGDLEDVWLVFGATDDRATNAAVFEEAEARGVPVNVVDDPELCSFTVPSIVARGELQIAISTGGASPALAAKLRGDLEEEYGPEYATLVEVLGEFRGEVLRRVESGSERRRIFEAAVSSDLVGQIRSGKNVTAKDLLQRFVDGAEQE